MQRRVRDYMANAIPLKVQLDTPMIEVMSFLLGTINHAVIVVDGTDTLQGIITGTDIIREIEKQARSSTLIEGNAQLVMTPDVTTIPERSLMLDAVELIFRRRLHTLVVTAEQNRTQAVGLISQMHIIQWWLDEFQNGIDDPDSAEDGTQKNSKPD